MGKELQLPYRMPGDTRGKVRYLARLIEVEPVALAKVPPRTALRALSEVVLYRHMARRDQREALAFLKTLPQPARNRLETRILDVIANPSWGMWSLSSAELKEKKAFLSNLNGWASYLGVSGGLTSIAGLVRLVRKGKGQPVTVGATLVAAGFFALQSYHEGKVDEEMIRRLKGVRP